MLQKIYFMVFERYIPELKKYDSFSFLHQPMASGQPLKIVQRHMAHPVERELGYSQSFKFNFVGFVLCCAHLLAAQAPTGKRSLDLTATVEIL